MVWYQHSIDVTRAVYGVAHPNMALVWTHMAVLLKHQGKLKEAIALYERVLDLRRDASCGSSDDNNSLVAQVKTFLRCTFSVMARLIDFCIFIECRLVLK